MPEIHHYKLTPNSISGVLTLLSPHLPHSLSLYRRLQFRNFSPSARLLSTLSISSNDPSTPANQTPTPKWIIAFADRSRRPETEVFLFSSWESDPDSSSHSSIPSDKEAQTLVAALLGALADLPIPPSSEPHDLASQTAQDGNIYTSHLSNPQLILLGAIHDTTALLIRNSGALVPSSLEETGMPEAYHRWVFPLHRLSSVSSERFPLSAGLVFGELREEDFGLVRARTAIPRQDRTLRSLPRVGVYDCTGSGREVAEEGQAPVAWAFLGVDGSLSTLHVEEGYRGRGVARAVATRLWEGELRLFTGVDDGERWASADVATYNRESNAVCKGLGGEVAYIDHWLRVDLEKVR